MTQSSNKTTYVDDPIVTVRRDGDLDQIVVYGKILKEDFYPVSEVSFLGFSDGTMFRYDGASDKKLHLEQKGYAYIEEIKKEDMYSTCFTIDEELIDWVICGELS